MKHFLLVSLLLLCSLASFAQPPGAKQDTTVRVVSGQILSLSDSTPVRSADVVFKGRASSVFSDTSGRFTIKGWFASDTVLVIAKEGFLPVEVRLSMELEDTVQQIAVRLEREPDYVQIGFGRLDRRFTTGAYGRIGGSTINQSNSASFDQALTGRMAGLQAVGSGGIMTSLTQLRLRGINSIVAGSEPLIIIDGIPVTSGTYGDGGGGIGSSYGYQTTPLAEINNQDIESITVLKDAAAAGAYGARGGNGVILVNTRRGRAGRTRFDLDYYSGATSLAGKKPSLLNGEQYTNITRSAYQGTFGVAPTNSNYLQGGRNFGEYTPANDNALDQVVQGGALQQFTLSASGGNKRVNFFLNANYRDEKGAITGSSGNRFSTRFNADNQATDNLRLGISNVLSLSRTYLPNSGLDTSGGYGTALSRSLPVHPLRVSQSGLSANPYPFNPFFQPYQLTNLSATQDRAFFENERRVFRNAGALYASYDILKSLTFRTEFGLDYYSNIDRSYRSRFVRLSNRLDQNGNTVLEPTAYASDFRSLTFTLFTNNTLTYTRTYNERHSVMAQLGHSYQRTIQTFNGTAAENFPNDYSKLVSAGAVPFGLPIGGETGFAFVGYFARLQYALDQKYLLGASLRTDASSRYGDDAGIGGYGLFPTLSAGWVASQEDFLKGSRSINYLKIRGSAGRLGNSLIGNEDAQGYWRGGTNYVDPPSTVPGQTPYQLANPNLSWENIDMANLGFEAATLNNRLGIEIDLFTRTNSSAIIDYPLAPTTGVDNSVFRKNGGKLNNKGIEITLSSTNTTGALKWTTDFNFTFVRSKVIDLGDLGEPDAPSVGYNGNRDVIAVNGGRIANYYLARYAGIAESDDPDGRWKQGDELLLDREGNRFRPTSVAAIDSARVVVDGKFMEPAFYGGINNTFTFRGFDLSILFTYTIGNYVLDQGERLQSYVTGENNLTTTAANRGANLYYSGTSEGGTTYLDPMSQRNTTANLHKADFVRLRYLSLGYTLPASLTKRLLLERARVYVAAQNLFLISSYKGADPEFLGNVGTTQLRNQGYGITAFDLPQLRSITGGVSITF